MLILILMLSLSTIITDPQRWGQYLTSTGLDVSIRNSNILMKSFRYIILFWFPLLMNAQNHTAITKRHANDVTDSLSANQIHVFSNMLENMVFVDEGTFMMGDENLEHRDSHDNKPAHLVEINAFFIGRFEVTQEEWVTVMGENPALFKGDNLPVENVSWNDIIQFIARLNELTGMEFRLPSEAEWEYAAKGGKYAMGYDYAGSDFVKAVAWFKPNSKNTTHPVGYKRPNELGIFDMSGNVAEWCFDTYERDYYQRMVSDNPRGPDSGANKVNRGGGWLMDEYYQRVDVRNVNAADERNPSLGFRLAM